MNTRWAVTREIYGPPEVSVYRVQGDQAGESGFFASLSENAEEIVQWFDDENAARSFVQNWNDSHSAEIQQWLDEHDAPGPHDDDPGYWPESRYDRVIDRLVREDDHTMVAWTPPRSEVDLMERALYDIGEIASMLQTLTDPTFRAGLTGSPDAVLPQLAGARDRIVDLLAGA